MPIENSGRLAIWNECAPGYEGAYEKWYQTEHMAERLSVPGFRRGRRYEAIDPRAGYFTYYETDNPNVLTSDAYLQRVNNPTPKTADIMREALADVSRTVCKASISIGNLRGAFATTLQLDTLPSRDQLQRWAGADSRVSQIARVEGWQAVGEIHPLSTEAKLRGGDSRIRACLLIETLRERDCRLLQDQLEESFGASGERPSSFRLLCELSNE